ncbi:Protein SDS23 [Porphyridium purpureum]|uniref:Protein SDS23 n=1 Tax=Porphyridium purpureum TaxID=35688 RepID=A0A5J4YJY1_PORPP|nr:Protein SDS23 [Porphyridium purpureum]|eukprot:POR1626..scf297_16
MGEDGAAVLAEFWGSTRCGELVEEHLAGATPEVLRSDMTIGEGFARLVERNILSALVERPKAPDGTKAGYCGLLSYRAVLEAFLEIYPKGSPRPDGLTAEQIAHIVQDSLNSRYNSLEEFCRQNKPSFIAVDNDDVLNVALGFFVNGTHRLTVVDGQNNLVGTLTQSMVLKHLKQKMHPDLDFIVNETLELLGLTNPERTVMSCFDSEPVLSAVSMIVKYDISSVAILDDRGLLTGSVSLSDIKYIFRFRRGDLLWAPLHDFLRAVREFQSISEHSARDTFPYFGTHADKSLAHAINRMVLLKTHRLWIVDDFHHVRGCVSITDVIRKLASLT